MIAPTDAIEQAINTAAGAEALNDLARLVWRGHSENVIDEDDAQRLSEQIGARRPQSVQIDGSLDGFARSIMARSARSAPSKQVQSRAEKCPRTRASPSEPDALSRMGFSLIDMIISKKPCLMA